MFGCLALLLALGIIIIAFGLVAIVLYVVFSLFSGVMGLLGVAVELLLCGLIAWGCYRGLKALVSQLADQEVFSRHLGSFGRRIEDRVGHRRSARILWSDSEEDPSYQEDRPWADAEATHEYEGEPRRQEARERATDASRARDYEYLDVERGTTPERIIEVMGAYEDDEVVGPYARAVIDALDKEEFRARSLLPEIDAKFSEGSLSWERFMGPAQEALSAVERNCALLANRVQAFDTVEYRRIENYYRRGGRDEAGRTDSSMPKRWQLLEDVKRKMDDIVSANEGLLLELGKLSSELGKLDATTYQDEGARIAQEVHRLADETKYYR